MNLHQYAKNHFSSFCSRDIVNLKVLQSDWLRAFWPISQKLGICARIHLILKNFFIEQIQKKLMAKFSNKFKTPCFWPIFPILGAKRFYKKICSCHAQQDMGR